MPPRRTISATLAVLVVLGVAMAASPYVLPTTLALGPCGRDWTSPSAYLPRPSPTRSTRWTLGDTRAKVCYGSPATRDRRIFGALVPWGTLWRTGANEPTRIFTDGALEIAGIEIPPGRYSLYTIPGPESWRIFVTDSTFHWGNAITTAVRERELGSGVVRATTLEGPPVESLSLRWQAGDDTRGSLVLEWGSIRIDIPVATRADD